MQAASSREDVTTEYMKTFHRSYLILSWTGRNPLGPLPEGFWQTLTSSWFFYLYTFNLYVVVTAEITYMLTALGNAEHFLDITSVLTYIGFVLLAVVKYTTLSSNRDTLLTTMHRLEELYPVQDISPPQQAIKELYLARLHFAVNSFSWMYGILICLFSLFPLMEMFFDYLLGREVKRLFPYIFWYPFDPCTNARYPFVYLVHVCAGLRAACGIVGPDCILVTLTSHLCMLFAILHDELEGLMVERGEPIFDGTVVQYARRSVGQHDEYTKPTYERLGVLVTKHQILISAAEDIEQVFNLSILINFLASSVIICLVGFEATAKDMKELVKFIMFLLSSLVQLFMICWFADKLMENSAGLSQAVYNSRWYDMPMTIKKALLFIMVRSKKPSYITALKFSSVSLNSFTRILSSSWSYFTLLRTMYDPSHSTMKH